MFSYGADLARFAGKWAVRLAVASGALYGIDGLVGSLALLGLARRRRAITAARAKWIEAKSATQRLATGQYFVQTTRLLVAFLDVDMLLALEASCRGAMEEVAADSSWRRLYLDQFGAPAGNVARVDSREAPRLLALRTSLRPLASPCPGREIDDRPPVDDEFRARCRCARRVGSGRLRLLTSASKPTSCIVNEIILSVDERWCASVSPDHRVQLWRSKGPRGYDLVGTVSQHRTTVVFAHTPVCKADGGEPRWMLLVGAGMAVHASDLHTGAPWNQRLARGGARCGAVQCASASPRGTRVVVLASDGGLALFGRGRGDEGKEFRIEGVYFASAPRRPAPEWLLSPVPAACALLRDDRVLATTRANGLVLLGVAGEARDVAPLADSGDVPRWAPLGLRSHDAPICALARDDDGRHCVTGSWDGTACLWKVDRGRIWATMRFPHRSDRASDTTRVTAVALLADRVVTGADDYCVRVFAADSPAPLRQLKPDDHDHYCGLSAIRAVRITEEGVLFAGDTVGDVLVSGPPRSGPAPLHA